MVVDTSFDPIPEELRQAFDEAVGQYSYWDRGGPEPLVTLGRTPWTISAVCNLVTKFNDPMPDNVYQYLCGRADSSCNLQQDRSYGNGARCLYGLIQARKSQYGPPGLAGSLFPIARYLCRSPRPVFWSLMLSMREITFGK
jgi:hypothetical protein